MAISRKNLGKNEVENIGLSSAATSKYARFINKNGKPNIVNKTGSFSDRFSIYNILINMKGWKFVLLIFAFYTAINLLFAIIYYLFCIQHLKGIEPGTPLETFEEVYFFSSQTLTTVGYGRISPSGFFTNTVSALEALIGILTLALITGLLYGRFVKPKAYVRFSHNAIIAPFKGGRGLMFRVAPIKGASVSEVSITVTVGMMTKDDGNQAYKYFQLPLQISSINSLFVSWTIVHPLNEESPLYNLTMQDLEEADFEMMIYLRAFDEDFSNTVIARTSYTYEEIVNGAKFIPAFYESEEGKGTIAEHHKLNHYEMVEGARI